jgi:hypothetical protein
MRIDPAQYGGAIVRRRIDRGTLAPLLAGTTLTAEELRAMPISNLRALIDNRTIEPWPTERDDDEVLALRAQVAAQAERIRELEAGEGRSAKPRTRAVTS